MRLSKMNRVKCRPIYMYIIVIAQHAAQFLMTFLCFEHCSLIPIFLMKLRGTLVLYHSSSL